MKCTQEWATGREVVAVLMWETRECLTEVMFEQRPTGGETASQVDMNKNIQDGGDSHCED